MNQQPVDIHTISYRLWQQALAGDPDGALLELEQMDWADLSVLSADLLARLYVRTDRLDEARALWQGILRVDPNYPPAVNALNTLNSPWLVRAVAKRYSVCFGVCVLILFALYGLGMCILGGNGVPFALMGMAAVLAVLGIYLAGLFGWAYITMESLFGPSQGINSTGMRPGRGREHQSAYSATSAPRYQG